MCINGGQRHSQEYKAPLVTRVMSHLHPVSLWVPAALQSLGLAVPAAPLASSWSGRMEEREGFHSSRKISGIPPAIMNILDRKLL